VKERKRKEREKKKKGRGGECNSIVWDEESIIFLYFYGLGWSIKKGGGRKGDGKEKRECIVALSGLPFCTTSRYELHG